ncbi:hypothetical protein F383_03912 [Gossypium arboreum]|uniref:Uncharacterized protein n=1 Tax=Gossypium arboreum TaxID=29729 RepID=A0A0B0PCJ4_GOSAR|nr:hypothetical protein F383_03912 [Gossypium arboreum]
MVDKSLHSSWDFLYPIYWNIELLSFCRQDMCHFIFHPWYASPSTQASLNPSSSVKITACKHALASAMVEFKMLFHG